MPEPRRLPRLQSLDLRRAGRWLLFAVPILLLVVGGWQHRWMSDDGFIDLRVVRMIVSGHGPVFNVGQRVEANTSALWVLLLAIEDLVLPIRLEWIAVLTGMCLAVGGLAACMAGASRLWSDERGDRYLVPIGALVIAATPAMWDYASSGLETGLTFAWVGASTWLLARWARSSRPTISAATCVTIGLGPLVRPDLAVVSIVFVAVLFVGTPLRTWRERIRAVALVAALPAAYQLFRMGYYGALVPNTYFAKEGGRAWWAQGGRYLTDFVGTYWLWVPIVILGPVLTLLVVTHTQPESRRQRLVVAGLLLGGVLYATIVIRVGGDFMHARLLLPAFMLVLAPVAVVPLTRGSAFAFAVVPWVVVAVVGLRPRPVDLSRGINDLRAFQIALSGRAHPVTIDDVGFGRGGRYSVRTDSKHQVYRQTGPANVGGHPLAPTVGQHRPVTVAYGIGALGYALGPGYTVLDALGLADPLDAHFAIHSRGRRPGHEKVMSPPWIWARVAATAEVPNASVFPVPEIYIADRAPTLVEQPNHASYASLVNAARAALTCPLVRRLNDAMTAPLTPARFMENAVHAITDFDARISPNPLVAERDC